MRFGLVGGGLISHSHIAGASHKGLAEFCCGCFSRNPEKNRQFGEQYNLDSARVYPDYQTMAEQEAARPDKPDFIVVCTPHISHYEVCKAFLEAGFPVVCDKPLTVDGAQAEQLAALAREKDLPCCVTYVFSVTPYLDLMRSLCREGRIGNVYYANLSYRLGRRLAMVMSGVDIWQFKSEQAGPAGSLSDICTHIEYIARRTLDTDLEKVLARLIRKPGIELDGSGCILFETTSGIAGQLDYNQLACGEDDICVWLYGDAGTLRWHFGEHDRITIEYTDGRTEIIRDPGVSREEVRGRDSLAPMLFNKHVAAFAITYADYAEVLTAKAQGKAYTVRYPTFEDGLKGVKFIEAALESHQSGNQWVHLK